MGHSHKTYEEFDRDGELTRPLHGHVTEFKDGTVPRWVKKPRLRRDGLLHLFGMPYDKYDGEIPRRDLPDGVSRDDGGRHSPTKYVVEREAYLEQSRERRREMDEDNYRRPTEVRYELNMRGSGVVVSHATGSGPTVPDEIKERLSAVRNTSRWDREVDGHHVTFSKWELAYELGPRGGITDVHIKADLHH